MDVGDTLTCRLYKGGKIEVTLDDRVYPDRSCGQYEAGWWVFDDSEFMKVTVAYFLSESGILYDCDDNLEYTVACGIQPGLARRMQEILGKREYN